MAPLEPQAVAQSNRLPLALFSGQAFLVTALSLHVLRKAYRASRSLPPSTATRSQEPARNLHVAFFAVLSFLSLASVTGFAVVWRAVSYLDWADKGNHRLPGALWTGSYGTGETGVGMWKLGDWLSDTDLIRTSDDVAVAMPESFLYTAQHFVTLVASSIFIGIEGRRRNFSNRTILSFVALSALGSLSHALNLFFVLMLYTPLAVHHSRSRRRDPLFTPKPAVLYIPVYIALFGLHQLPAQLSANKDVILLRWGYVLVPLFLAFAPQIVPASLGHRHQTKASVHRSYARTFHAVALASFIIHWKIFGLSVLVRTPQAPTSVYDKFLATLAKHNETLSSRFLAGTGEVVQRLKLFSTHPAVSVITVDVYLTAFSLVAWAFIRDLDIHSMLENSVLSFLAPKQDGADVSPRSPLDVEPDAIKNDGPPAPARKPGRPRKAGSVTEGAVRRSSRKASQNAGADDTYQPPPAVAREVEQMDADGAGSSEDLIRGGEATALTLFLCFFGGLGQAATSVLGAEASKTGE